MTIISAGEHGYIGIGLSAEKVPTNRMPGWDFYSFGYHGDDGKKFESHGRGTPYGPTYTTGDIIGCCLNCINKSVFYTKNGKDLPIAFRNVNLGVRLYPFVGFRSRGEILKANFGNAPFKFDIQHFISEQKKKIFLEIFSDSHFINLFGNELVLSHLINRGYSKTLQAFINQSKSFGHELPQISNIQNIKKSIENRKEIFQLILDGKIKQAISNLEQTYPSFLENQEDLLLALKAQEFIAEIQNDQLDVQSLILLGKDLNLLKQKIENEYICKEIKTKKENEPQTNQKRQRIKNEDELENENENENNEETQKDQEDPKDPNWEIPQQDQQEIRIEDRTDDEDHHDEI
eukprot:Anaeramoba_ignava/c21324_g6_i2.p1 GENE.c21324_g6_i2~~c21324_g6_i2.p1  ORF type:complete len:347 (-),score=132.23 c21324_g6_i2:230-1270(-)